jgi:hypothetical protein
VTEPQLTWQPPALLDRAEFAIEESRALASAKTEEL